MMSGPSSFKVTNCRLVQLNQDKSTDKEYTMPMGKGYGKMGKKKKKLKKSKMKKRKMSSKRR